jgi:hypothetical protein
MRVYLSGGMEFANNRGSDWRAEMERRLRTELGWEVFNPVAESRRLLEERHPGVVMRDLKESDPERFRSIVAEIVRRDSAQVAERTDLVVCLWDEPAARGAGTQGELTLAHHYGRPVYLVTAMPYVAIPGWVIGCTTRIFGSFEELMEGMKGSEELRV